VWYRCRCIVDFAVVAFLGMNTYRMLKLFRRHANYFNNQYRKLRPDEYDDIYDVLATELNVVRQTQTETETTSAAEDDYYAAY